jgi:dTDP-4-dehydrorhamnose reductase
MKIWVTGSNGMLAQAIRARLISSGIEVVCTGSDLNIGCARTVQEFAKAGEFTCIINCAAYTKVDEAEKDASTAYQTNAYGAGNVALAALSIGANVVHFSTDYVFDGESKKPYTEDSVCSPKSVYGASKYCGDLLVLPMLKDGPSNVHIIRTSWLFGYGGSNFVNTMLKLMREKEIINVVYDQFGNPTFADDLARAALMVCTTLKSGIYNFTNSNVTNWYLFANKILEIGLELGMPLITKEINPVKSSHYLKLATRPLYSELNTELFQKETGEIPRDWQDALLEYMKNII